MFERIIIGTTLVLVGCQTLLAFTTNAMWSTPAFAACATFALGWYQAHAHNKGVAMLVAGVHTAAWLRVNYDLLHERDNTFYVMLLSLNVLAVTWALAGIASSTWYRTQSPKTIEAGTQDIRKFLVSSTESAKKAELSTTAEKKSAAASLNQVIKKVPATDNRVYSH